MEGMEDVEGVEGVEVMGGGGGMPRRKRSRPAESAAKEKEAIKVVSRATVSVAIGSTATVSVLQRLYYTYYGADSKMSYTH